MMGNRPLAIPHTCLRASVDKDRAAIEYYSMTASTLPVRSIKPSIVRPT